MLGCGDDHESFRDRVGPLLSAIADQLSLFQLFIDYVLAYDVLTYCSRLVLDDVDTIVVDYYFCSVV